jgi:periplasmic protein TonB
MRLRTALMASIGLHAAGVAYASWSSHHETPPPKIVERYEVALMSLPGPQSENLTTPPPARRRKIAAKQRPAQLPKPSPVPEATQDATVGHDATDEAGVSEGGSETGALAGATTGEEAVDIEGLLSAYRRALYSAVDSRKQYPLLARRGGMQGTVFLEVVINRDGRILRAELLQSSGHEVLDRAAMRLIRSMGKLPKPPTGLNFSEQTLQIPLRYSLT